MAKPFKRIFPAAVLLVAGIGAYLMFGAPFKNEPAPVVPPLPPERMLQAGPVGENITIQKPIGRHTLLIKADTLYLKKTKTFGFDNALIKQAVATGIEFSLFTGQKKRLSVYKDKQSMKPDMSLIRLEHPVILYPDDLTAPRVLIIDAHRQRISFVYNDRTDIWDLTSL